jgi:hypothetical protein
MLQTLPTSVRSGYFVNRVRIRAETIIRTGIGLVFSPALPNVTARHAYSIHTTQQAVLVLCPLLEHVYAFILLEKARSIRGTEVYTRTSCVLCVLD